MIKVKVLNGDRVRREVEVEEGTSVRDCVALLDEGREEFQTPTVCLCNGEPLLRKDGGWESTVVSCEVSVVFVEIPLGGGGGSDGSTIVRLVTAVAATLATIFIPYVGWLVAIAISIVGSLIANSMAQNSMDLDEPESAAAASPTYNVNSSGNMARLFQPEPEGFGRMRIVPDYVAQTFAEYVNNDQYGYFIYGIGRGLYNVEAMYFGDTVFWQNGSFIESGLVSEDGEEFSQGYSVNLAIGGDWSGPYPAVASGAWAKTIRVVVNFPDGYGVKTITTTTVEDPINGDAMTGTSTSTVTSWEDMTATILLQYAEIDDAGNVIGNWSSTKTFTAKRNGTRSWGEGMYREPQHDFSKTISFRASKYARWAIRIKNGSAHIPHPQIEQFVLGQGTVWVDDPNATVYETMRFTNVASTALSCAYQFCEPGQQVTLFPTNVSTSQDVGAIDLLAPNEEGYEGWVGPYAANAPDTETTEIRIDYAYVSGLGRYNENGGLGGYSVGVAVEAQKIDSQDSPVGGFFSLGSWDDWGSTTTPQRRTRSFRVPAGRYWVRMRRTSNTHASERAMSIDKLQWVSLRAVLPGQLTFPQSVVAIKIKATNALSQQASQNFSITAQRKLPLWTPDAPGSETGTWGEPVPTSSWAAAVSAICQESWGGGLSDSQLDLKTLWAIDARLQAKGWYFNAYIDNAYSLWRLIMEACQCVCVAPRLTGTVLSFVEDEPGRPVNYELNARNIVRGSFQVTYATWTDDTPDDVIINYLDEDANFQQRDVQASLPESESNEPSTLDWIGITNREQAFRVATRYSAMNRWRRVTVTCQVEALGRLMQLGDVVSVNHPRFRSTASGTVGAWSASGLSLTLEPDFAGANASDAYISLTRPDGTAWGPVKVASIEDGVCVLDSADYSAYLLQGNDAPFSWLSDGTDSQPTCYALHATNQFQRRMLVQSVSADDLWHYTLTLVNDAPEVSQYDDLPVPAWNGRAQTNDILGAPKNLAVKWTASTGIATVVWRAVRGAVQYEVQHSADGVTWLHDGITTGTSMPIMNAESMNWSGNANAGTVFVRVAAISNSQRSQWAEWPEELDSGVWDVFVVAGQSNAVGFGNYTLTAQSEYGEFYDWNSSSATYRQFVPLADPVYVSSRGSAWPWFADRYHALTGRRCIILNIGSGASVVTSYSGTTGTNSWANDGVGILRTSRSSIWHQFFSDLKTDGRKHRIAALLWCQGESDAGRIYNSLVTASDYKTATIDVWTWFRNLVGKQSLPVINSQIGYFTTCATNQSLKTSFEAVQNAQAELCASQSNVYMGFTGAKDFLNSHMSDPYHYDEYGYRMMGEALAGKAVDVALE